MINLYICTEYKPSCQELFIVVDVDGEQMAEWLRRLTGNVWVPSSIPGSNSLCSCHSLQRGGAVAKVTELALSLLWRHSW